MRYAIIAILLYVVYVVFRTILRSFLNKKTGVSEMKQQEKPKRTYDMDQVQDAEFKEVKKDPSV
jgi:hypothetical protein